MDEIIKIFREIAYEGRKVRLLNLYKGIPVSYAASITSIGEASVTVSTEKIQLVAMYMAKETHIQNIKFPYLVRAGVVLVNPNRMDAMLSHFTYQPERLGQITRVRIEPGYPMQGQVSTPQMGQVEADLTDISLNGLGILVDEAVVKSDADPGDEISVQVQLPGMAALDSEDEDQPAGPHPITLQGKIINVKTGLPNGKRHLGVELHPNHPARLEVARFISQRQLELLREVHSIYELIRHENEDMGNPSPATPQY